MTDLDIRDLHVTVASDGGRKEILRGIDLSISSGQTHAIMGPNGSGKSTLAYSIAGHPRYEVTGGSITLDGADVLAMSVDERARAGLFLAMQYPVEVPGVSVSNFHRNRHARPPRARAPNLRDGRRSAFGQGQGVGMRPAAMASTVASSIPTAEMRTTRSPSAHVNTTSPLNGDQYAGKPLMVVATPVSTTDARRPPGRNRCSKTKARESSSE